MSTALLGVVLCGGQSARMGHDKSLLEHPSGGSFLQHATNRLEEICDQVCIASSQSGSPAKHESAIIDPVAYQGPVIGIINSLEHAENHSLSACLITPVDMPNLTTDDLQKLIDAWQVDGEFTCGLHESENQLQPLVAIYNVSQLAKLKQLAASDDRSLYRWIQRQPHQTVSLSAKSCHNVNVPTDLKFDD